MDDKGKKKPALRRVIDHNGFLWIVKWRRGSESNRRPRLCRPLHDHSATPPLRATGIGCAVIAKTKKGKRLSAKAHNLRTYGLLQKDPFSLKTGAGNEARTRDPNLGKVVLYH